MNGIGYASNSILSLGEFDSYFRLGEYIYDPSGRNAVYYLKSLGKDEMKKHLMKHFTKEEIIEMLLRFVENGSDHQDAVA